MLKFLSFESEPIGQPAAVDPLERQTWCSLRIQVGKRPFSRFWDKALGEIRGALDIPAFPVAEWCVKNWWSLFNELCPRNSIPRGYIAEHSWHSWTRRHCLRSADSSLLLPELYIYSDGRDLVAEAHADREGSLPHLPGEFLGDETEVVDSAATQSALSNFIDQTFYRVADVDDDRAARAIGQWRAIQDADDEEVEFCRLAGRMGLDPYDREETPDHLAEFFEAMLDSENDLLVRDLTETATPDSVAAQWRWVKDTSREFVLGPSTIDPSFGLPPRIDLPAEHGYQLARRVREFAAHDDGRIESVEKIASVAVEKPFEVINRNQIPGQGVKAIVGQSASGSFIVAVPENPGFFSRRFRDARSLYHAIATTSTSQRLVTAAYSSDQKASRAFAAELLAPQAALIDRLAGSVARAEAIDRLSREFQVSAFVVQLQLENAGVALSVD